MAAQEYEADRNDEDQVLQYEGDRISDPTRTGDDEDAEVLEYDAKQRCRQQNEGSALAE